MTANDTLNTCRDIDGLASARDGVNRALCNAAYLAGKYPELSQTFNNMQRELAGALDQITHATEIAMSTIGTEEE